jgi:uncharacterized protein
MARIDARSGDGPPVDALALADELFAVPDGDAHLLYAPLEERVVRVNGTGLRAVQALRKGDLEPVRRQPAFVAQLLGAGLLRPRGAPAPRRPIAQERRELDPSGATLFLTNRCTMRCTYCYSSAGADDRTMPWRTARAAIDWICDHAAGRGRDRLRVSFHGGGEVTVAASLLRRCVAHAREAAGRRGLAVEFEAGLNGTMDAPLADWIATNLAGATLSLDGLPEIQNAQRPLSDGAPSFPRVAAALRRRDRLGFRYGIRTTVTQAGLARLPESVRFMCENFGARTIQVEPFFPAGRALERDLEPVDPRAFVQQYRLARAVAADHGRELKYSGARLGPPQNSFCGVSGRSFAVTVDGIVTACYEVSDPADRRAPLFHYGRLGAGGTFVFDRERVRRLLSLTVENKPACAGCFCKWQCAGECAAKLAQLGDAWDASASDRCIINRELTKDRLKERLLGASVAEAPDAHP